MRVPVAYLRKSHVQDASRDVSHEVQLEAVTRLAALHGDENLVVLSDWAKSGMGHKTHLRGDFAKLRAMLDRGEVSALYSYSLSRLARSVPVLSALVEQCARQDVPVRLHADHVDTSTATGRLMVHTLSALAAFEAEVASERTRAAVAIRRAQGVPMGIRPYGAQEGEDVGVIVAAYQEVGSAYGAARRLNEAGHRTRRGALWSSKTVADVLTRQGVMYRHRPRPGAKANADWITYQLLTCPCGNTMTAMDRRSPRVTCYRARHVVDHPRPFGIAEKRLLPALMAEAAMIFPPEAIELEDTDAKRRALEERRERIVDMAEEGVIAKADRDRRLAVVDTELEALESRARLIEVPQEIDWSWEPRRLNRVLRGLWSEVQLGPDLMPMSFTWRVPGWRRP
jgi:DNA invertase Pin-like site-specific DNA recombinase